MADTGTAGSIPEVGVICGMCHKWNNGQHDSCNHCGERVIADRPLGPMSVAKWVNAQIEEWNTLGSPLSTENQAVLRRWATAGPLVVSGNSEPADPEWVAARTRELMTEHGIAWLHAWALAEQELVAESSRNPSTRSRPSTVQPVPVWLYVTLVAAWVLSVAMWVWFMMTFVMSSSTGTPPTFAESGILAVVSVALWAYVPLSLAAIAAKAIRRVGLRVLVWICLAAAWTILTLWLWPWPR